MCLLRRKTALANTMWLIAALFGGVATGSARPVYLCARVAETVCFSSAELIRSVEAAERCVRMKVTSSFPVCNVTPVTLKQIASLLCCLVQDSSRHHDRDAIRLPEPQLQHGILSSIMFPSQTSEGQSVTRVQEIKEWWKSRRVFLFSFFTFSPLVFSRLYHSHDFIQGPY